MLSDDEIRRNITDLANGWGLKMGKTVKSFQFSRFMDAIEFVSEIAKFLRDLTTIQLLQLTGRQLSSL
jgi:pterin-4a-carbinolamine dehydratase